MSSNRYIDILNSLCNSFIADGQAYEEVIELLLDAGANIADLKAIGFNDEQISNYAYYEAMMSDRTEEEVLDELMRGASQ